MAIILPYSRLTDEQIERVDNLLGSFEGEVSQCSLHSHSAQVVLNEHEITAVRGQQFLDELIKILESKSWGTDLPTRFPSRSDPPKCYTPRYTFNIPYDPNIK